MRGLKPNDIWRFVLNNVGQIFESQTANDVERLWQLLVEYFTTTSILLEE
jgi:hypothetical protein